MSGGVHLGDLRIDTPGRFRGMVDGRLTIGTGCDVDMAGMVNGTLVVEPAARVLVSGVVNGSIVDRGGDVSVTGMVTGG